MIGHITKRHPESRADNAPVSSPNPAGLDLKPVRRSLDRTLSEDNDPVSQGYQQALSFLEEERKSLLGALQRKDQEVLNIQAQLHMRKVLSKDGVKRRRL